MKQLLTLALSLAAASALCQARLIAQLAPGANPQTIATAAATPLLDTTPSAPFALFAVPTGEDPNVAQLRLQNTAGVVWAEDDENVELASRTGGGKGTAIGVVGGRDELVAINQGYLSQIAFYEPRAFLAGRTVRIAILDTGLSIQQHELWAKTVAMLNTVEPGIRAWDVPRQTDSSGNGIPDEGAGHGTMVAGLIDQVAPLSKLVVCRVADSDGRATAWSLVKGLAFAVWQQAEVVNISLGSANRVIAISDVMDWVEAKGTVVVAAAGNANQEALHYPAGNSKVLAIAGVDRFDIKAPFSNYDRKVNLSAPAVALKSQFWGGTFGSWSGTSFAAPLVSGAIADCLRRRAKAYPTDIRNAAETSGDDLNAKNPAFDRKLGRRLNIARMNLRFANLPNRP